MENPSRYLLATHISVLLFGAVGLLADVSELDALSVTAGRCIFAALGLCIVQVFRRKRVIPSRSTIWNGLLLALHWWTFFYAIVEGAVELGLLCFSTYPLFTFLLRRRRGTNKMKTDIYASISIIIGAGFLVIGGQLLLAPYAIWAGLASAFLFAVLQLRNEALSQNMDSITLSYGQLSWASLFCGPALFYTGVPTEAVDWGWLMLFGLIFTALAHTLFIESMRHIGAQRASFIAAIEPLYGIGLAALFWHVDMGWEIFPATLFIVMLPMILQYGAGMGIISRYIRVNQE